LHPIVGAAILAGLPSHARRLPTNRTAGQATSKSVPRVLRERRATGSASNRLSTEAGRTVTAAPSSLKHHNFESLPASYRAYALPN